LKPEKWDEEKACWLCGEVFKRKDLHPDRYNICKECHKWQSFLHRNKKDPSARILGLEAKIKRYKDLIEALRLVENGIEISEIVKHMRGKL